MTRARILLSMLVVVLTVAACSQGPTPAQQATAKKAANEAAAQKKLDSFHKLLAMKRTDLAVAQGHIIDDNFPGTAAAASVAKALPALEAKVAKSTNARRLAGLWLYQVSPMAGGTQSTASIYNTRPEGVRVHLVLRRHTKWGTSAFLYDQPDKGFVCHKRCNVVMHFDGHRHVYKGYLPDGSEPAMFIKDYKGFIARLKKADKVTMEVTIKGRHVQTLVYETGGFDAAKWKPAKAGK